MSKMKRIMLFTYKNQKQVNMLSGIVVAILIVMMIYLFYEDRKSLYELLGALGSLATFGAFVFLFLKDKFKQDQIDKLTLIAESLNGLYQIERDKLKPFLWLNGGSIRGIPGELKVDINNKGEYAKLLEFKLLSGDLTLHSLSLPFDIDKGERRFIFARANGNYSADIPYEIEVIYKDKLENHYSSIIKGKGPFATISEPKSIPPQTI
jgi:Ca2+/Na+ antiporter